MKQSLKNFIISLFAIAKPYILKWLEKDATKVMIATFVKGTAMLDFRMWAVKFLVDYLGDHVVKPTIDYFFRKLGYEYEVIDGEHLLKKIANSTTVGEWEQNADKV